jgi:hypothetical protein
MPERLRWSLDDDLAVRPLRRILRILSSFSSRTHSDTSRFGGLRRGVEEPDRAHDALTGAHQEVAAESKRRRCSAHRRKLYGALHLAVTAVASLFLLAFNPLVVLHSCRNSSASVCSAVVNGPVGGRCPPGRHSRRVRKRLMRRAYSAYLERASMAQSAIRMTEFSNSTGRGANLPPASIRNPANLEASDRVSLAPDRLRRAKGSRPG